MYSIGDKNGVLQCLSIKDEEPVIQFKTLPGKPITSVQLGSQSDKIFAASGNEVKGYTKKGKVFLTIETTLSETITSMCVLGADLILCSGRMVTHYRDLREFHSYLCDDRVLDIAAFAAPNNTRVRLLVLVANKGAVILENGQCLTRASVLSGPTRLVVPPSLHSTDIYAFYGAADGSIGVLAYDETLLSSKCLVEGGSLGAVVCVGWFVNTAGTHLAVGRQDGSIQLYLVDINNIAEKPRLKYTYLCGDPITSVGGGCVGTEESELLVATFSGRVFALRSRRLVSGVTGLTNVPLDALSSRRVKLESEIARLEKQVANEREKYQRNTRSVFAGLSTPPLLDIQIEISGATKDAWQEINITSAVALDMLFVYSEKKLQMETDNVAVLSICSSKKMTSDFSATVRCQAGTRRLWVRMRLQVDARSSESSRTECLQVLVYVLPASAPRVARVLKMQLPALPYYSQHVDPDIDHENRSWCELHVSGSFSVAEMTSWLSQALPGELPRPAAKVSFARCHTLLKTLLTCRYQRGEALIKSDNISTITTVKDILSNCSVDKSIQVEMSCDIPSDCCLKSFEKIQELFKFEYQRYKDISLKKGIRTLDLDDNLMSDDNNSILCKDYMRVWKSLDNNEIDTNFKELVGYKNYSDNKIKINKSEVLEVPDVRTFYLNILETTTLPLGSFQLKSKQYSIILLSVAKLSINTLSQSIKQWYTDWRASTLLLFRGDLKNDIAQLHLALLECRLDKVVNILNNQNIQQ